MDYFQCDVYYMGVSYGYFDMEWIFWVMWLCEDQIVIKESGMYVVEDYIMSCY